MGMTFEHELANLNGYGITIDNLHADEIEDLVVACRNMSRPFSRVNQEAVGFPIQVCDGVVFWKLTIGASVWLDEYAKRWWLDTNRKKAYYWAVVYALRHGHEPNAFHTLTDEASAFSAIKSDAVSINATEAELNEAIDEALEIGGGKYNKKTPQPNQQTNWSEVVTRLEAQTGIPIKSWSWDYSADHAIREYRDLSHFAALYSTNGHAARMRDELDVATTVLAQTRARIIERVTAERAKTK